METELFRRYVSACEFKQKVDPLKIEESIKKFFGFLGVDVSVKRIDSFRAAWDAGAARAARAAGAAWAAGDAWAARAAGDAGAAGDAWDAWAAGAAGAAGDAWAARAAGDARAARAAGAAGDARDAWDAWAAWAAGDAGAAGDAWDAWAAGAAGDAWAARAAGDARAARDAVDEWAAWAARAAWAAGATRDALAAWDAWDASWYSTTILGYEKIGDLVKVKKWLPYFEAFEAGLWLNFNLDKEVLWLPIPTLELDNEHRCHADGKTAFICEKEHWHFLHGTFMEPWMVETQAEQIDPIRILSVKNVEQRMRLMQKVGMERMLEKLSYRIVDVQGDYSLLTVDVGLAQTCPYLKMLNPSTGTWHMEGVESGIKTVQEAINWRWQSQKKYGVDWKPEVLT